MAVSRHFGHTRYRLDVMSHLGPDVAGMRHGLLIGSMDLRLASHLAPAPTFRARQHAHEDGSP